MTTLCNSEECVPLCNHCLNGGFLGRKGLIFCTEQIEVFDPCHVCGEFVCYLKGKRGKPTGLSVKSH